VKTRKPLRIRHGLLAGVLVLLAAPAAWSAEPAEIATGLCFACHGEGGNSVVPAYPNLAGQDKGYMEKQLREFFDGKRKNEIMDPILSAFSRDDIPGLAAWYAAQKPAPGTVAEPGLLAAGKAMFEDGNVDSGVPACVGCHLDNAKGGGGSTTLRYPRLAGQHQTYTIQQMNDFKNGVRTNDKGKLMRAVAERMTEQEMKAVAEYLASLP
jgi:cytochrome c553